MCHRDLQFHGENAVHISEAAMEKITEEKINMKRVTPFAGQSLRLGSV